MEPIMAKLSISVPDFLGDNLSDPMPITELQPRLVRGSVVKQRWGVGDKAFKTLVRLGILTPKIEGVGVVLFDTLDVLRVERDGWNGTSEIAPSENWPLTGDRAPEPTPKK